MCLTNVRYLDVNGWSRLAILYSVYLFHPFLVSSESFCESHRGFRHRFRDRILLFWLSRVWLRCSWLKCHRWLISLSRVWLEHHQYIIFAADVSIHLFPRFAFNSMSFWNLSWCFLRLRWLCRCSLVLQYRHVIWHVMMRQARISLARRIVNFFFI